MTSKTPSTTGPIGLGLTIERMDDRIDVRIVDRGREVESRATFYAIPDAGSDAGVVEMLQREEVARSLGEALMTLLIKTERWPLAPEKP